MNEPKTIRNGATYFGRIDRQQWNGWTVLALGDVDVDPDIPEEYVVRVPNPAQVRPENLVERLPGEHARRPLALVMPEQPGPDNGAAQRRLLMHLLRKHYHAVFERLTRQDPPGPLQPLLRGLRDPSRSIHQLQNYPWLLRYPLVDQLQNIFQDTPALILVGGPSFRELLPRLPELAKHCLVICIARTLRPCLEAGVEPDFVVQYDTNPEQAQFYEELPRLEHTTLVSLSTAYIAPYADLFRGVLFRGSFGKNFLPNPFTMREGTEGSLIACLGLVEVLGCSHTFVTGTDLSWPLDGCRYGTSKVSEFSESEETAIAPDDQRVHLVNGMWVRLRRRDGEIVNSNWNFVAAAVKAETMAREINQANGTRFFTMNDSTLLDDEVFPTSPEEAVRALPTLDRHALRQTIDTALTTRESIHLERLYEYLKSWEQGLASMGELFAMRRLNPKEQSKLKTDMFVRLLENFRGACWMRGMNDPVESASRFIRIWKGHNARAAKLALAHHRVAGGIPLPLLCRADEQPGLLRALEQYLPGGRFTIRLVVPFGKKKTSPTEFDDMDLKPLLDGYDLILVSPAVQKRYRHFWSMAPDDSVLDVDWLAGQRSI